MRSTITSIIQALYDPSLEFSTDEAASLISAVDTARAAGDPFDALSLCLALIDLFRRQLQQSDDGEEDVGICDGFEQDASCHDPVEYGIVRVA